jgi:hypothetical protein
MPLQSKPAGIGAALSGMSAAKAGAAIPAAIRRVVARMKRFIGELLLLFFYDFI